MAARDDILKKVNKSRQEAEQRIRESNKKAEADRQKSQETYRKSTSQETQRAASYMKDYSAPSRDSNDIASYTDKRKKASRWYKGDAPTEAETIAYSVKVGQQDKEKGREIYNLYQQAKADGHWAETYDKATSQYMTALGLTADQVNDDFFAANADLFDYGVTTAAGNLSTAKRNGAEALLAADLKGLYDDYQKTKTLQAEQDQAMKEAKYWMAQGLTDDEIKAKLDIGGANSKYKNLYKAIEKTATGEYEPTTAPIQLLTSYGVDGMLYALRNPDSSTGDYLLDAVQREMGRGVKGPEASDSRRDMTSASYAPYAVGMAGMDEYGIKYGRTSFDRDWLNSPEGLAVRNNPETTKDYAAIWEAVENTEAYKAEVEEFNADVRAMIDAGSSPDEIFTSDMLDDYPEVKKLYEAQQKGMPLKTASAIDFDISAMYDEADKAYKANVGKISSEAYDTDVSAKLGTPSTRTAATAGTQTQTAEQMRVARSIFAPYATPSELNVFKTIGPSYGDTKGAVLNGITNGTSGEDQAYLSAMDAADMYAAEFYLPSVQKMNSLNREKELFDKYEAFLAEWEPRLAKEGPGLMGTDEFKAAQAEIKAAKAVWNKYDGSPDELNAAIENEKKIQQNIDRKYGDAQLLNKNGITGLSVKPMLDFAAQFESFVPGRYADTEWGARMSKGESWDAVSKDMAKAKASNDQLLLMIDTTLKQAEKFGINKEYTAGLKRAQEALLEENQLIEFTSARGNEDYSSRIAEVDGMDLRQAVASAEINLLPDRIMMAVLSPDTLARKMADNALYEELALAPRMTEQEVNDYKYYLAESPEKAAEYYNALTPMLRVRAAQEMEEQAAADVDTIGGGIGASIASVLVNTAQGFMLPSMALKSAAGEEIDPYSIEFLPSLYSQTARSEIKGNIKGKFGDGSWQEKALNFAYEAVMTGADSTAAAIVGKPFGVTGKIGERAFEIAGGLMLQSSSAAMSTLMDIKMRGGTDAQAWKMAGITAAAEAASEYLPMENLSKMMSKGVKSGFKAELLKQISSDAPGEMLSELVGSVSDQVIMQELSNWEASYNQYVASGLSDEEARKQADLDVWKGIGYAGLLSVGTSTGSVALAAGIGKAKNTFFKSRAETVLSEATAKGASKADQTATVSAAMESMGTDPVEADAAAQAMASVDPNAAATVQSILVHTEDPAVVDAIRLGSMVPDSQTGQILSTIQQEGATDENVQALVETAQAENAVPEIQNQYETALTNSVEAMASVNAMLGSDNSNVAAAKEAVTQAEQNLKAQQQSIAEAEGEMQAATSVLQNARKRFNAKPADQKAKASVTKAIARYQQAQGRLEQVRATTDIAKAQEDLKAARAGLESARNEALTAARQAAQPIVQETMSQREQRQVKAEQTRIAEQEESNLREMEFQNYLAEKAPNATPEQIEQLRADFFAVADELSTQGQQDTVQPDEKNVRFAETIGKRFNINVEFRDTKGLFKGAFYRGTNTIILDSSLSQGEAIFEVALHELTHKAESGGLAYNSYANSILDIAFGGDKKKIRAEIAARKERYNNRFAQLAMSGKENVQNASSLKPLSDADARKELVADLTRRVLYGDEQLINQLVESNPDAAYTFLDWVKDTLKRMVGIKGNEVDQLNRTRELFEKALSKADERIQQQAEKSNHPTSVQFSFGDESGYLLNASEYKRLRSNWSSQQHGAQFENRPNGGKIVAMDNLLVYTSKNGEPEQVVEVNAEDLWQINDIQQDLIDMEREGESIETQRAVLEGVYGTGSAYFREGGAVSQSAREDRAGAGRNARAVRNGNRVEISYEDEEVNLDGAQFALSDDADVRREDIRAWRAARLTSGNELGEQTPQPQRPQGERQFVAQTMPNTEAVPEWIWREFQRNPDELNYDIDTNREQVERGWQRIQQEGYDNELNRLMDAERFSADDTAEANLMMAMALRNEDPGTFMALASKYNKEGTEAGKELQARKLFSKMTPTGARIWVAGKLEAGLGEFIRKHRPLKQQVDQRAQEIADEIRNLDSSDQVLRLMSGEETTIDSSNNRWGIPINQQQQALIDHYGLGNVARPGIYYNRATTKQRMLEAILATPNPLALTGNGLNLIQRLEFIEQGAAVITNADLNYIGSRLSEFVAYGAENGGRGADVAVARAYEAFGNITPATRGEKARTWRYVAMLTSVPSAIRNIIGNASQNLVNAASHGIAVEIDKLLAGRTGQRTAAHLDIQERVQGWRSFVEESRNVFRDYFVDRVTTQRGEDKFNTHQRGRVYQTQALEAVRNVEGFLMSFGDRNIWRKAYVNSIAEQQKLADQNLLFNDDGTTRTHEQILEQAEADANYATFSEDSQLSTIMGQLKRIPGIGAIVDFIMPFTGVPTNITRRMIQYSPAGIATAAYRAAVDHHRGENFDQHRFVNDLSRGLTGTAMMGLGVLLAEMGAIKLGTGEEEDKKKYALQTAMGQQYTPYILNPFTNEYVSLSVFSPAASAITMGAAAYNDFKENDSALQAIKSAAFGSFDQIFDASYMSSLSDLFSGQGSVGENLIDTVTSSAISQNVPAVLGQLANALDPYVRDTKDKSAIMQAFKSGVINKIPFLRNAVLPEKVDVTGQTVRTKEGIRNFFDPFTTTDRREDPAIDELFRLNESLGASNMLPSDALSGTKMTLTVSVKEGKKSKSKKVTVDAKGKETYRKRYGELWLEGGTTLDKSGKRNEVEGVRSLINSKAYQRMDDVERAEAIADILSEAKIGAGMEALKAFGPDPEEE